MDRPRDRDRDRDRERDRDRDRDRGRDRYGGGGYGHPDFPPLQQQQRRPSRFSDAPHAVEPCRSGFSDGGGALRALESPPRQPPAGGFRPVVGDPPPGGPGGFRPMGGGFGGDFNGPPPKQAPPPLSGQKRGFPFSGHGFSPEHSDGRNFVKLFVGSVPRTATEDDIRPLFEEQGNVLEVAFIKDKRTGQQQGCCFIKYATSEEADSAIRALHNQYTLPGGIGPIQVRYADGERERLGNGVVEFKLFVGSLNKLALEKEVEEIFAPYGRVDDVYLMRDDRKQSRGCGFVKFSSRESAMAAINALNGVFMMRGCDQPLTVRFADPKRPRAGEARTGPAFGGPGFDSLSAPGIRSVPRPNFADSMGGRGHPNAWQPMSPQGMGPSHNAGVHGLGNQFPPRPGDTAISPVSGGHLEGSIPGAVSVSSASPQNYNQSFPQAPPSGQQISTVQPLPSPQHFPAPSQLHQGPGPYPPTQISQASMRPFNQPQTGIQAPYSQTFPSPQAPGLAGQLPPAQFQVPQSASSAPAQPPRLVTNIQPTTTSSLVNTHLPAAAPHALPSQQSPSPLAQMLSQQTQTLQATYQSSQQAISQLQQQVQMMHPSNPNQPLQQNYHAAKQQSQWTGVAPTSAATTPTAAVPSDIPSTASVSAVAPAPTAVKCNWTEHTSPDGYKYYYNSVTSESRWVKPEELTLYEQQQKLSAPQTHDQPSLQPVPMQQITQSQQPQFQTQFRQTEQLQPPMYQASRGVGNQVQEATYSQLQAPANSVVDRSCFQQGFQATPNWAWNTNSGGT